MIAPGDAVRKRQVGVAAGGDVAGAIRRCGLQNVVAAGEDHQGRIGPGCGEQAGVIDRDLKIVVALQDRDRQPVLLQKCGRIE